VFKDERAPVDSQKLSINGAFRQNIQHHAAKSSFIFVVTH